MIEGNNIYLYSFKGNYFDLINKLNSINTNIELAEQKAEVTRLIINFLHSFGDLYEYIEKINDDKYLKGFVLINNQLKHDKELLEVLIGVSNSSYPYSYPCVYGGKPHYIWNNFKDNEDKRRKIKFRPFYDKYLVNKEIKITINKLYEMMISSLEDKLINNTIY